MYSNSRNNMPSTPVSNRLHFNDHTEYLVYSTFMDYWDFHETPLVEITPVLLKLEKLGLRTSQAIEYLDKLVKRGALIYQDGRVAHHNGVRSTEMKYGPNGMAHGQQY